jgi:hypothetical protein
MDASASLDGRELEDEWMKPKRSCDSAPVVRNAGSRQPRSRGEQDDGLPEHDEERYGRRTNLNLNVERPA